MNIKKTLSLLLASLLALSCMTACGDNDNDNGEGTDNTETTTAKQEKETTGPEENTMPIANGDITLSLYTGIKPGALQVYKDLSEHPVVKIIEDTTGINLTFIHPPQDDDGTFFNTTIASGVLPDIINESFNSYPGGPEAAIDDGVLMDITDLVNQYGYYYNQVMSTQPDEVKKKTVSDNGTLIRFCSILQPEYLDGRTNVGLILRKDLLEKNNMDMPQTLNEYEAYFEMCKKEGIKTPLALPQITDSNWKSQNFIANAFGVTHDGFFLDDNNNVVYSRTADGYKDYVALLHDWYQKGYLTSDFLSATKGDMEKLFQAGNAGMIEGGNWQVPTFNSVGKASNPDYHVVGSPYPTKTKDQTVKYVKVLESINTQAWFVSNTCQNPVQAIKFLDYWYSPDLYELTAWGPGNKEYPTYEIDSEGKKVYTEWMTKNPDYDFTTARNRYILNNFQVMYNEVQEKQQYEPYPDKMETWANWASDTSSDLRVPDMITPSVDEARELSSIMSTINTYSSEQILKFITGDESLDNWDKYVEQINNMSIDKAIQITQDAVERYYAR